MCAFTQTRMLSLVANLQINQHSPSNADLRVLCRFVPHACKVASKLWPSLQFRDACNDVLKLRLNRFLGSRLFVCRAYEGSKTVRSAYSARVSGKATRSCRRTKTRRQWCCVRCQPALAMLIGEMFA